MIETTYKSLEQAANELETSVDALFTAALEKRIRLWALLFEEREYWEYDYSSEDENQHDVSDAGCAFFEFIPIYSWHIAGLLRNGVVTTDVLSVVNRFQRCIPRGDHEPITLTREQTLYVLREDLQRLRSIEAPFAPLSEPGTTQSNCAYHSKWLRALLQASRKFWQNADRDDPDTHPANAAVASWLSTERGYSASLADKAATIIRPEWAHVGRKPEK